MSKEEVNSNDEGADFNPKSAPKLKQIPYVNKLHGKEIADGYHWVEEEENQEFLKQYVEAENNLAASYFSQPKLVKLQKKFMEWVSYNQLDCDDYSYKQIGDYLYYLRPDPETKNITLVRKPVNTEHDNIQVVINTNDFIGAKLQLNFYSISSDQKLVVFGIDKTGNEDFTLVVYDIENQKYLNDEVTSAFYDESNENDDASGFLAWHSSGNGFFYVTNKLGISPKKLMFHTIGTQTSQDKTIIDLSQTEKTLRFDKNPDNSRIIIDCIDGIDHTLYQLSLSTEDFKPELIVKPTPSTFCKLSYHPSGYFYAYVKDSEISNGKILRCKKDELTPDLSKWEEFVAENQQACLLPTFYLSSNHAILTYISDANYSLIGQDLKSSKSQVILKYDGEPTVTSVKECNPFSDKIKVQCASLLTPDFLIAIDVSTLEQKTVGYNFVKNRELKDYGIKQIFVPTDDDTVKIPVTLLYKTSTCLKNGTNPLYLSAYGAFDDIHNLDYHHELYYLLEHGIIYASAHVRGGGECGHKWHEEGMLLKKKNTFNDFISVAKYLVQEKYVSPDKMIAVGSSAGGTLVGSVINQEPDLFKAVIAKAPAVDIFMEIPEVYNEFGNFKEDKGVFEYMHSYSPYSNVTSHNYPHLFVIAGFNDPRVKISSVAKWIAKLRENKTDDNIIIFNTDMDAGHFYSDLMPKVMMQSAFILDVLGMDSEML